MVTFFFFSFFFLEITPFFFFFFNFEAGPLPQRSGLELNLNVPILLKKLMKRPYIWSRAKWPSIVPIVAFPDMVTLLISIVREEKFAPEEVPSRTLWGSENPQLTTADLKTNDHLEIRKRTQEKRFCKIECQQFFAQVV